MPARNRRRGQRVQRARPTSKRQDAVLGAGIRTAREAAGLHVTDFARQIGVSASSALELERGADSRLGTLARVLAVLPGIEAHELLGQEILHPRPASESAFLEAARAHGFSAECVHVRPKTLVVERLRPTETDSEDPSVRRALMRAACQAPGALLRHLEPTVSEIRDGRARHSFAWSEDGALTYRCSNKPTRPFLLEIPTRSLRIRGPGSRRLSVRSPIGSAVDIAEHLYPGPLKKEALDLVLPFPPVGLRYDLTKDRAGTVDADERWGAVLRHRKAVGLNRRELAELSGLSPSVLAYVEEGRQPRRSTAVALLQALPSMSPQLLLPAMPRLPDYSAENAWDEARRLHGLACDEVIKTVLVAQDGTRVTTIETLGLRSASATDEPLSLNVPFVRAAAQSSPGVLATLESNADARLVTVVEDGVQHSLRWGHRRGRRAVNYRRVYDRTQPFALTQEEERRRFGDVGELYNAGVTLPIFHAAARAHLVVRLPLAFEPRSWSGHAWPLAVFSDAEMPVLAPGASPPVRVRRSDDEARLILKVERPRTGFQYGISWILP